MRTTWPAVLVLLFIVAIRAVWAAGGPVGSSDASLGVLSEPAVAEVVVATVNDKSITRAQYRVVAAKIAEENRISTQEAEALPVLEDLIDREILAQKAIALGLDERPDVRNEMQMLWREALAKAYVSHYEETHPVTRAQLEEVYESQKEILWPRQFKLREIVVEQKSLALRIAAEVESAESFSQLALRYSVSASRDSGGFLGWMNLSTLPLEAQNAVAGVGEGAWLEQPLAIEGRWHLYFVEKIRRPRVLPFGNVSESMRRHVQRRNMADHIAELRKEAKVEKFSGILVGE